MRTMLWSGGFDSTALLLETLRAGDVVRPVYIRQDDGWQKQIRERDAMARIRFAIPRGLRRHLRREVEWTALTDTMRPLEQELVAVNADGGWTSRQNAAFVGVAADIGPVEVALVDGDRTVAQHAVVAWMRERDVSTPTISATKRDLLHVARRHGYDGLLDLTWSCEAWNEDAVARPCGQCEPCIHRIAPHRVRAA